MASRVSASPVSSKYCLLSLSGRAPAAPHLLTYTLALFRSNAALTARTTGLGSACGLGRVDGVAPRDVKKDAARRTGPSRSWIIVRTPASAASLS